MPQAKPGRHCLDRRTRSRGQAFDSEKQLMLLRLNSVRSRSFLTEVEKLANPVAELCNSPVLLM
jgi:hypothetical protein